MKMTAARLGQATEQELQRRIKANKASLTEQALYGEVEVLREAVRDYTRRLAVAYPKQMKDFFEESRKILNP